MCVSRVFEYGEVFFFFCFLFFTFYEKCPSSIISCRDIFQEVLNWRASSPFFRSTLVRESKKLVGFTPLTERAPALPPRDVSGARPQRDSACVPDFSIYDQPIG